MPILGTQASQFSGKAFGSFESIATATVGSGGTSTITFDPVPSTFNHLQLRVHARTNRATVPGDYLNIRFNDDTGSNYTQHSLSTSLADTPIRSDSEGIGTFIYGYNITSVSPNFSSSMYDIFDYKSTNKTKVLRGYTGTDSNADFINGYTASGIGFISALWNNSSSPITKITITPVVGTVFVQHSHFALYGIKG